MCWTWFSAVRVEICAVAAGCRDFDPISFGVHDREHIEQWAAHLDAVGVPHSSVIEASLGWLLVFDDPDGLQLHLYSWAEHGLDHSHRPGYGHRVESASGSQARGDARAGTS
jgi:hypothetical protein